MDPLLVIVLLAAYFLPAIVAAGRGHHNAGAILVLTLLLGWTALGWIAALVWACTAVRSAAPAPAIEPTEATRKCPICAERVQAEAVKCRFCGAKLPWAEPAESL